MKYLFKIKIEIMKLRIKKRIEKRKKRK